MPGKLKRSSIVPIVDGTEANFEKVPSILLSEWQSPNEEGKRELQDKECQDVKYDYPDKAEESTSFQRPIEESTSPFRNTRLQELSPEIGTELITAVAIEQAEDKYAHTTNQDNRKVTNIETTRRAILNKLCNEAKERVAVEEIDVPTVTCAEQCMDLCCQDCVCDFKAIFTRQRYRRKIYTDHIMTPALRRGRAQGWTIYKQVISSSVADSTRVAWVVAQLLASVLVLVLSSVSINLKETEVQAATFVTFACAVLGCMLSALDITFVLWSYHKCRSCRASCAEQRQIHDGVSSIFNESQTAEDIQEIPENEFSDLNFLVNNRNQTDIESGCTICQAVSDILRIILSEFFIYVFIICGIFEAVIGQGKTSANKVSIAVFIISGICLSLFVHFPRFVICIRVIKNVQAIRSISREEHRSQGKYDPSVSKQGLSYQIYIFAHIIMQMIVQAIILVSIGGKVKFENKQFFDKSIYNNEVKISSYLWCMIIVGYFLPIVGILTAFSTAFFWAQEFSIGLCLDTICIIEIILNNNSENVHLKETVKAVNNFLNIHYLIEDYHNLRNKHFLKKFLYPLRTPLLVIICMLHASLVAAFAVSAGISSSEGSLQIQILNGGGWIACYAFAVLLFLTTNVYAALVVAVWTAVILATFLLILMFATACICHIVSCFEDRPSA